MKKIAAKILFSVFMTVLTLVSCTGHFILEEITAFGSPEGYAMKEISAAANTCWRVIGRGIDG